MIPVASIFPLLREHQVQILIDFFISSEIIGDSVYTNYHLIPTKLSVNFTGKAGHFRNNHIKDKKKSYAHSEALKQS